MTDSNSGITQGEGKKNGIYVIPMPFNINGEDYFEDIDLTQDEFYEKLMDNAEVMTSQPSVGALKKAWDDVLIDHDAIVYIPMSSGLSGSCQTAMMLADDHYVGKVFVVDAKRISVTQKRHVYDALDMVDQGLSAQEIYQKLSDTGMDASIYITVATLEYLKKGGRLTPAVAAVGSMLRIKPVLTIQGEKLDLQGVARTMKKARKDMIASIKKDIAARGYKEYSLAVAYTYNREAAEDFKVEIEEAFPGIKVEYVEPLSLSISCHIGPDALAIALNKKI